MIIAIMGESNAKAREGAYNIALCERAKVILIWERNFLKRQRSNLVGLEFSNQFGNQFGNQCGDLVRWMLAEGGNSSTPHAGREHPINGRVAYVVYLPWIHACCKQEINNPWLKLLDDAPIKGHVHG